jgi:hypothetical protein
MDPRNTSVQGFINISTQFLETLRDAWPEFQTELDQLKLVTVPADQGRLLETFRNTYGHLFTQAMAKDVSIFQDPLFAKHADKIAQCPPETMTVIWQYLEHLIRFATMRQMYSAIPENVMSVISEAVVSLKDQIEKGTIDQANINPFAIGQNVMNKLSPEAIEQMTSSLLGSEEQMNNVLQSMQILMGGGSNIPGAADLMKLLPK